MKIPESLLCGYQGCRNPKRTDARGDVRSRCEEHRGKHARRRKKPSPKKTKKPVKQKKLTKKRATKRRRSKKGSNRGR